MPRNEGPWGRKPRAFLSDSQRRRLVWVAIVIAGGLALFGLSRAFPDAIHSDMNRARLLQTVGVLVLVSSTFILGRRFETKETIRNIAIWCGVFAILVLAYSFRTELESVVMRVRGELVPSYPVATGAREMTLQASADGSFYVHGEVNGAPAQFLVDTGASDIVLSPADAERAGIDLSRLNYGRAFETAHGIGWGATTHVSELLVGLITLRDVTVTVNKSGMDSSLLGLAFLRKLESFTVRGKQLTLRWRE